MVPLAAYAQYIPSFQGSVVRYFVLSGSDQSSIIVERYYEEDKWWRWTVRTGLSTTVFVDDSRGLAGAGDRSARLEWRGLKRGD